MDSTLQSVVALGLVVLAAGWLVWRTWKRRSNPGCGNDCACPSKKLRGQS